MEKYFFSSKLSFCVLKFNKVWKMDASWKKSFLRLWGSYLYLTKNWVGYKFSKKDKCNYDKIIFHHWIFEFSLKCVSFVKRDLFCKRDRGKKRWYSLTNEKLHRAMLVLHKVKWIVNYEYFIIIIKSTKLS